MRGISLIICCYNSSLRLPETLRHISLQEVPADIPWELIIVDNNSTDQTTDTSERLWMDLNVSVPLVSVKEPSSGLSLARKKGIATANYDFVIFCDDDNWLSSNFVRDSFSFLEANNEFAAIGGQSEAVFEHLPSVPEWFEPSKADYAVGTQSPGTMDVTFTRCFLWGAGLALRKSAFLEVYNDDFPLLLADRSGKELTSGGDSEVCLRMVIAGYKLFYDERLSFKHFIPRDRLTDLYRQKLLEGFDQSRGILKSYYFFIWHFTLNRSRMATALKWNTKLILTKAGLIGFPNAEFSVRMLSIYAWFPDKRLDSRFKIMRKLSRFRR